MKNILVPTDFSDCSLNALNYAVELARRFRASIVVFHSHYVAVETGYPAADYFYFPDSDEDNGLEKEMEKLIAEFKDEQYASSEETINIQGVIKNGLAIENILDLLNENTFDLIVMGTKGATGLEEIFLGSFTYKVVEKASIPTLIVPQKSKYTGIRKIVYATDFKGNDIRNINDLTRFSEYFNAGITCLHISKDDNDRDIEEGKMSILKRNYIFTPVNRLNFDLVKADSVEKGLQRYLATNKVDLLAIMPQNRAFVENLFHSSLTRKLSYHSDIPLLVIRP